MKINQRPSRKTSAADNARKHSGKVTSELVCQHRRGPCEFSCGFAGRRAVLVEESLEERERKG
jgi:hypothetical protein